MAIASSYPTVRPSLLLDFSNQTVLDPRVTFTRTTTGYYYDNHSAALAEQNLLLYSNTFTNAYWQSQGISTPVLNATDPAGTASGAYTLTTGTATTGVHCVNVNTQFTIVSSSNYTISCYLQAGAGVGSFNFAALSAATSSTNYINANFTLTGAGTAGTPVVSGTFTSVSATITQIGSTAWYRCSLTFSVSSGSNFFPNIQFSNSASPSVGNYGYISWTSVGTETLLVYGAQLEQRSTPLVYTATTATAVNTYTPTLQTAAINAPRFDYNPTTRESLGLLLEQAATNNQLYSSSFDNAAWTKTQTSITTAADISPDGTQNAQLMVLSTTSAAHTLASAIYSDVASTTYTLSIYAKAYGSTSRYITFGMTRNSNDNMYALCNFDLVGGTAGTAIITPIYVASATANIQLVGNGWYRCSVTYTTAAVGPYSVNMFVVASNTSVTSSTFPSFAGNGFDGYLLWGAQNETAPSATSYIATTSAATTRTVDSASMTGTNFTSWYNYSGGTMYVEAASGNPSASALTGSVIVSDGTNVNRIGIYFSSSGINNFAIANGATLQSNTIATPTTIASNTFYKTSYTYSITGTGVSSVGQTATTSSTSIYIPAVNQLLFSTTGSQAGASPLNGRIKKFAYYPLALTNTQIQSLSAN